MTEKLAVVMARKSMERADVAMVMIDAEEGVTALDANIAGYAHDAGCSILIIVNKWDALKDKKTGTPAAFERALRERMKFLDWAPVITDFGFDGTARGQDPAAGGARQRSAQPAHSHFTLNAVLRPGYRAAAGRRRSRASQRRRVATARAVHDADRRSAADVRGLHCRRWKPGLHFSYERYVHNPSARGV